MFANEKEIQYYETSAKINEIEIYKLFEKVVSYVIYIYIYIYLRPVRRDYKKGVLVWRSRQSEMRGFGGAASRR